MSRTSFPQSRGKDKKASRGFIKNPVSIDEPPSVVEDKIRIGDWEIDLIIGKDHSGALVTIVERKASFPVSKCINDKSAKTVTAATLALLQPFTNTNGLLRQYWSKSTDFKKYRNHQLKM